MFCRHCGANNDDSAKFCDSCGEPMVEKVTATIVSENRELNIAQLVWSIISLLCFCMPLGIAALIFTVSAQNAKTNEEEQKLLKRAKTCNIISVVLFIFLFAFIFGVTLLPLFFIDMMV